MYTFYGRLKKEFPSQIIIDLTEKCNLACRHCPHAKFQKSHHYTGNNLKKTLHHKLVNEVAEQSNNIVQQIRYTANGEPFLHPEFEELVLYAIHHSNTFVSVTTNGHYLSEDITYKLLAENIGMIDISIDAFSKETYKKIRVNGNYSTVKQNVLNAINLRKKINSTTKIVVSFVIQELNSHESKAFEKFWYEQGVDFVILRRLHSASGSNTLYINKHTNTRIPCVYPWERITLNANGFLAFCPNSWTSNAEISDYEITTVKKIWHSLFYENLRKAHLTNDFKRHPHCGNCPDWQETRWPNEGRGYGDLIEDIRNEE